MSLEYARHLAACLQGTEHDEPAQKILRWAHTDMGRAVRLLRRRCVLARVDPDEPDPWTPLPRPEQLGQEGLLLGRLPRTGGILRWLQQEWHYSMLLGGAPGFGKTTLICVILLQLALLHVPVIVFDLRGDYEWVPLVVRDAVLIPWRRNRDNLLSPLDDNTPLEDFAEFWMTYLGESFGLQDASIGYGTQRLLELFHQFQGTGRCPDLLDFRDHLLRQNVTGKPDLRGYRDRLLDKITRLITACGDEFVAVEKGFNLKRLITEGRLVIYRVTAGKSVSDFYVGLQIFRIYKSREFSEERFDQRPVFVVLDEQRSILRERSQLSDRVFEMDRGMTLARAMRICFIIAEQVVSELSRAVRVSTRTKVAFNTQGDELRSTAEMMGLTDLQRHALKELAPGRCVVSIGGDRCPAATLIEVPTLNEQIQAYGAGG